MNEQNYQRSDILVVHDKSEIFMGKFDDLILKIKYNFIMLQKGKLAYNLKF